MKKDNNVTELTEEMELVGPGSMLTEARKKMGLTQKDVAETLNFRQALVADIEAESFDKSLPETFNRGYIRNYAKLVGLNVDEVLTSYEVLHVAEQQGAEMLSFSKGTSIKAENKRIMWASYFILAALIASTVVWWVQDKSNTKQVEKVKPEALLIESKKIESKETESSEPENIAPTETSENTSLESSLESPELKTLASAINETDNNSYEDLSSVATVKETESLTETVISSSTDLAADSEASFETIEEEPRVFITTAPVDAQFTFLGDCWVDIYDANGEHVAWGIKKEGYVMNITAVPPVSITLGKPELVSITFDGVDVDMNQYRKGNIAKFTLPVLP